MQFNLSNLLELPSRLKSAAQFQLHLSLPISARISCNLTQTRDHIPRPARPPAPASLRHAACRTDACCWHSVTSPRQGHHGSAAHERSASESRSTRTRRHSLSCQWAVTDHGALRARRQLAVNRRGNTARGRHASQLPVRIITPRGCQFEAIEPESPFERCHFEL